MDCLWHCFTHINLFTWLVVSTPLKNISQNWDDYSQYMESLMFQTTNQLTVYPPHETQDFLELRTMDHSTHLAPGGTSLNTCPQLLDARPVRWVKKLIQYIHSCSMAL